jgi:hypothetical protein
MAVSKKKFSLRSVDIPDIQKRYEKDYPQAMSILRLGGVYPGEHQVITNPYTGREHDAYFGNVGEHCMGVGEAAEAIANAIPDLEKKQIQNITERAIIHDSTKRYEVMRRDIIRGKKGADTTSGTAYTASAYESIRPILQAQGVKPNVIDYMANAGKETGHNSLPDFIVLNEKGEPSLNPKRTLAEKIVHLADDMTYTPVANKGEHPVTSYLTASERMVASDFPNRYKFLYKEGFGFDEYGNPVLVDDATEINNTLTQIKTYAQWQTYIAKEIANDLVQQMRLKVQPDNPEYLIKNLLSHS